MATATGNWDQIKIKNWIFEVFLEAMRKYVMREWVDLDKVHRLTVEFETINWLTKN